MGSPRAILAIAIVVPILLPMSILASGPYHQPYEERPPTYEITHESTPAFAETVEEASLAHVEPTPVDSLSPETQRAFVDLKSQPADSQGWKSKEIVICSDGMFLCDEYADEPDFPEDRSLEREGMFTWAEATVVEEDGERYVVVKEQTGAGPLPIGPAVYAGAMLIVFLAYGLLTAGFAYWRGDSHTLLAIVFAAFGMGLVVWPYLVMYTGLAMSPIRVAFGGFVVGFACWAGLIIRDERDSDE